MDTSEIELLIGRARRLLDYYEKVGVEFWGRIPAPAAEPLTREVVGMADYVSVAIDISNAIEAMEKGNDANVLSTLRGLKDAINSVIRNHADLGAFLSLLKNCIEAYDINVKETGEDDSFFCELACYSRELLEKVLTYMERYFGVTRESDLLKVDVSSIEALDEKLKVALSNVTRTSGQVAGTLPLRAGYTPESYWWYIRF